MKFHLLRIYTQETKLFNYEDIVLIILYSFLACKCGHRQETLVSHASVLALVYIYV